MIFIKECFELTNDFYKMLEILKSPTEGITEKHHIIPRIFFKKKGVKVINGKNLVSLTPYNHFLVHYYAWKCAKPIIKKEMAKAFLFLKGKIKALLIEEQAKEYQKAKEYIISLTGKKILCLEDNMVFNSTRECCNYFNIDRSSLLRVLKGKRKTLKEKHFIYYQELTDEECKKKIQEIENKRNNKEILCLELNKKFSSISNASKELNLNRVSIIHNLKGKILSVENYHFIYYQELTDEECKKKIQEIESKKNKRTNNKKKQVYCFELDRTFNSIIEALKTIGKSNNGRFNKKIKETNFIFGYHWEII